MTVSIPYDHPDRLRAIVQAHFGFLEGEAGFVLADSRYSRQYLSGRLLLRRADVELEFAIHNDDLDLYVGPPGASADAVEVSDVIVYFKHPDPDVVAAQAASPAVELSQDEFWKAQAADVKAYLARILQFAQAAGYPARVAELKRYQDRRVIDARQRTIEQSVRSTVLQEGEVTKRTWNWLVGDDQYTVVQQGEEIRWSAMAYDERQGEFRERSEAQSVDDFLKRGPIAGSMPIPRKVRAELAAQLGQPDPPWLK